MIKLQVLIATFGEAGLKRVAQMRLPELEEVEYLVSCQIPDQQQPPLPSQLVRKDLRVFFSDSIGLSRNRNILLDEASAQFCLIADDDLSYTSDSLLEAMRILEENPEISIIAFKYQTQLGEQEKVYPNHSFDLAHPTKGYYVTSFEIAFRREDIKKTGIRFNENFGVGSSLYGCGEEDLWLHNLLKKGLSGRFFPILLTTHKGATTGLREAAKPEVLRAQGVVIAILYPLSSFPRIILKAYRTAKSTGISFLSCFKYLLQGWLPLVIL